MSLQELWRLFPIRLVPYDITWKEQFTREKLQLQEFLPDARISHIGSTAIAGIWAKPIVDILAETTDLAAARDVLVRHGWICMSDSEGRISLNKGYTPQGYAAEVFHLHLRRYGDNDQIYFCAYLNDHPEIAKKYESLKLRLWKEFEFDRDAYTKAKAEFVQKYTQIVRRNEI